MIILRQSSFSFFSLLQESSRKPWLLCPLCFSFFSLLRNTHPTWCFLRLLFQFLFVVTEIRRLSAKELYVLVSFRCYIMLVPPSLCISSFQFLFVVTLYHPSLITVNNVLVSFRCYAISGASIVCIIKFQFLFVVTLNEVLDNIRGAGFSFFSLLHTLIDRIIFITTVLVSFRCYIFVCSRDSAVYVFQFLFVVTVLLHLFCSTIRSFSFFSLLPIICSTDILHIVVLVSFRCYSKLLRNLMIDKPFQFLFVVTPTSNLYRRSKF